MIDHSRPESQARLPHPGNVVARLLLALVLVQFALLAGAYWIGITAFQNAAWPWEALLVFATASTLSSLARRLPWQNVVLSALLIALMGVAVEVVGISIRNPLVLYESHQSFGQSYWIAQLWSAALVWIVATLNCRGVARLLLQRWQAAPTFGFWLLGSTMLLVVPMLLSFAKFSLPILPFSEASRNIPLAWPITKSVLVCTVGTFGMLLVVTPSLINKRPVSQPTDWHPLVLWTVFNLWFLTSAVGERRVFATALLLFEIVAVVWFALQARRRGRGRERAGFD